MLVVVTQWSETPVVTVGPKVKWSRRFCSRMRVAPARPSIEKPSNTWLMLVARRADGFLTRAKTSSVRTGSSAPQPVPPVIERMFWSKRPR